MAWLLTLAMVCALSSSVTTFVTNHVTALMDSLAKLIAG